MSKKVVGIFVLSLLLLSFLSTFVLAQGVGSKIFDPIKSMFTDWEEGSFSINIAKYLLTFLVLIFVYGVTHFLPVIKSLNKYIQFLFALVVSFLSMAFTSSSDLYAVMVSYTAMGFALSAIVPMLILVFFSVEVSKENSGSRMLSKFVWVIFIMFMIYKLIDGYAMDQIKGGMVIAYVGVIVGAILWVWKLERRFVAKLYTEEFKGIIDEGLKDSMSSLGAEIKMRDEKAANITDSEQRKAWNKVTKAKKDELVELSKKLGK